MLTPVVGVADSLCLWWPQFAMRSAIAIAVPDPLKQFAPDGERQAESPPGLPETPFLERVDSCHDNHRWTMEAWASQKSYQPKAGGPPPRDDDPRNPSVNFRGERRTNATHASTTDPDARLAKKGAGKEAVLSYQASVLTENRHGRVVLTAVDPADGPRVERAQAEEMLQALAAARGPGARPATVGADRGYDQAEFIAAARALGFTPHVAQVTPPRERDRSAHDPARRLRRQSTPAETDRADVRVGQGPEDHGWWSVLSRGEGRRTVHLRLRPASLIAIRLPLR